MSVILWIFVVSLFALTLWIAFVEVGRKYWRWLDQRHPNSGARQIKDEASKPPREEQGKPPHEGESNVS